MDPQELRGLMEAYNAIYAPQEEISEEQIWEEVEEDIEYLDEMGSTRGNLPGGQDSKAAAEARMRANVQRAQAPVITTGRGSSGSYQRVAADKGAGGDAAYRAGGGNAAARSGLTRQQIQQKGMAATRAAAKSPTPTKPAAPAAKPSAPAKPAATTPAAKPAAKPAAAPAAKPSAKTAPTSPAPAPKSEEQPKIKKDVADLKSMQAASQERQKTSTPQLSARAQALKAGGPKGGARERMLNQSFDMFDVVKGHLIDEGYAETEEAALAIMANMSDAWKMSIISQTIV